MRHRPLLFLAALLLPLLAPVSQLENGSRILANDQFEAAKAFFNRQDHFAALRQLRLVRGNAPSSGAPWMLSGHCFYLLGQGPMALFHYHQANSLNPKAFPLPRFAKTLGPPRPAAFVRFNPYELASLRRKIGQMLMVSLPGTALSGQKRALLQAGWIGGVILFQQNVESKAQVASYIGSLQGSSPVPLFVAVDQEGGTVRRFTEEKGFQRLPSLAALGRTRDPSLAYRFGLLSGAQLREVGANLNLAPVVDLDHGVEGSIITHYQRSLGGDPETVSALASEIIRGMRDKGVLATAKHFPTQSVTGQNPHERTAVTDRPLRDLEAQDLLPYRRMIGEGRLDAVMLSHVIYRDLDPYFPASLSPEIVQTLLRGKLGYQGLVISDDLRMDAIKGRFSLESSVVQAVNAGVDILLITDNMERRVMDALVEAVASGRVARSSVEAAYARIMAAKEKYGILAKTPPASRPPAETRGLGVPTKGQAARPVPSQQGEAQDLVAPIPNNRNGGTQPKQELGAQPSAIPQLAKKVVAPASPPAQEPPAAAASQPAQETVAVKPPAQEITAPLTPPSPSRGEGEKSQAAAASQPAPEPAAVEPPAQEPPTAAASQPKQELGTQPAPPAPPTQGEGEVIQAPSEPAPLSSLPAQPGSSLQVVQKP